MKLFANCRFVWAFAFGLIAGTGHLARAAQTQTIRLDPGWNLIAFQVVPADAAPAAVFGTLGDKFERAFSYENVTKAWTAHARVATSENEGLINPMGPIRVGRAYWVYVNQLVAAWAVEGVPAASTPPVNFSTGWNLVGIPTGAGRLNEPINMLSVLAASGLEYDTILKWEQTLYAKLTPADNDLDDFTVFDPNRIR